MTHKQRLHELVDLLPKAEMAAAVQYLESLLAPRSPINPKALTAYQHAKRGGLIGSVRGANPDPNTNPKHFEGFGRS
jgi:hypothetical protein